MFCSPMLSSTKPQTNHSVSDTNKNKSLSRDFSVTSSSTSTSSSPSLSPSQAQVTMEEVWKEINLGSLQHHRPLHSEHEPMVKNQIPNNSIFQDFLNMPLDQQQPPPLSSSSSALYASLLPPPATVLSLNPHSINSHFEESTSFGFLGKRRSQESNEIRGERRHKRMIKNRESAARSRARKQAYTNELKIEIAHLQTENARLRRQQEQWKMAEATQQHQTKKTLQRSWTCPF